jgi:sugar lactone lactonase YvrE
VNPDHVIAVENELGECVTWRESDQTLWWTDIATRKLYRLRVPSMAVTVTGLPERLASFGFMEDDNERLICAFETGFALFRPDSGETSWIDRPLENQPGVRMNDGRVDREGRFWAGSMVDDETAAPCADAGALFCVDHDLAVTQVLKGLRIANGLAWSLDGRTMFLADSACHEIRSYNFDLATGNPSGRKLFRQFDDGECPDGATVDASGHLWVAIWGAARVDCIDRTGRRLRSLRVPVSQPSCVCFGGTEMTTLFVSTARTGLTEASLRREPHAGALLIYENAGKGLRESGFRR